MMMGEELTGLRKVFNHWGNELRHARRMRRVAINLSRGVLSSSLREIDPRNPLTWEFSAFSQNGEDGVIDYLSRRIREPNRSFVEIGTSDGLECNCAHLAVTRKFRGIMIEGSPTHSRICRQIIQGLAPGLTCHCMMVTRENAARVAELAFDRRPDVLSLDIDGVDYHVADALFAAGFRPRVFVVEYNSVFGPDASISVPYRPDFHFERAHPSGAYLGVSITGWRRFFDRHGYRFVTVESAGVNAFFVDPTVFEREFLDGIRGLDYVQHYLTRDVPGRSWEQLFEPIRKLEYVTID